MKPLPLRNRIRPGGPPCPMGIELDTCPIRLSDESENRTRKKNVSDMKMQRVPKTGHESRKQDT